MPATKLALLASLLSAALQAGGGSEAGNGGGLAEKNVVYAYLNLAQPLELCLSTPLCRLDAAEQTLLSRIRASLASEPGPATGLQFGSEREAPGSFMIDGQVRVARTGSRVGDVIFVNVDLLYARIDAERPDAGVRAADVPLATSILVHELGHHQGVRDHLFLDNLGSKLRALMQAQTARVEFWNGHAALEARQRNLVRSDADKAKLVLLDALVLENEGSFYDLSASAAQAVAAAARCELRGLRLYNVHEERGVSFEKSTRLLRKPLHAWYVASCAAGQVSDRGDLVIDALFEKTPRGFEWNAEGLRMKALSCRDEAKYCR